MHIHPCMADSGRQEEERKMERQNWASERQSSLHPQSECWMSEEGLEAPKQTLTSLTWLLPVWQDSPMYILHSCPPHTHTCSQMCLHSHSVSKAFNCCDVVVDWTITFSYSSLDANKTSYWLFCFWLLQHIWFITNQSVKKQNADILPGSSVSI